MKTFKKILLYIIIPLTAIGYLLLMLFKSKDGKQDTLVNLMKRGKEIDDQIDIINSDIEVKKNAKTSKKKLANNSRSNNIKSIKSMLSRVKR